MIVVGSSALNHWGIIERCNDLDVWLSDKEVKPPLTDSKIIPSKILEILGNEEGNQIYATPDQILTIKCSHLGWDIFWWKHVQDVLLLKKLGYAIIPELYEALVTHWKKEHGGKDYLSLYQTKENFFQDSVAYVYDHDWLHELVAFPESPVYTSCLKEGQQVAIDKDKFFAMPFEKQVRMFREEISVIAAERWLIPPKISGKVSWIKAYQLALKKTCVSLTKNWATDFIVQNIEHFVVPEYSYFEHLLNTIKEGENVMSKVDLSIFQEIAEKLGANLPELIYNLCEDTLSDLDFGVIPFPERNGRSYSDESLKKECEEYWVKRKTFLNEIVYKIDYEHLHQEGGGEGGSEYCFGVFKLNGKVYKAEYSYYSHNGCEYEDIVSTLKEVKPVQKTTTVYE